ncbi:hypothetical protein ElyMa_005766200 [Elysia marginata]|uniref:Uncharacterized protein n=1 Tax=Elysia marginata TaxID=1093978 RepID=A0AAV4FNY8_9GAST|nr:hypothetical protein ElyMa_005766200 [Elysia marginata]
MGKLFVFREFLEATKAANCQPVEMSFLDFRNWTSRVSQYALKQIREQRPYLNKIVCAKFYKDSEELIYQTVFDPTEISVTVLKASLHLLSACCENRKIPRGIETSKKVPVRNLCSPKPLIKCRLYQNVWQRSPCNVGIVPPDAIKSQGESMLESLPIQPCGLITLTILSPPALYSKDQCLVCSLDLVISVSGHVLEDTAFPVMRT